MMYNTGAIKPASVRQANCGPAAADLVMSFSYKQATLQVLLQLLMHSEIVKANKQVTVPVKYCCY